MTLSDYLKANSLSLQAFGERVGVAHTTVMRWASGESAPRGRATLQRVSEATDGAVTAADFFPGAVAPRGSAEVQSPLAPEARALGLDPTAIAEAALRRAIGDEKARRWADENREAIEAWTRHFEENDTPLAQYRMF
jgi:antitoxin CcdA